MSKLLVTMLIVSFLCLALVVPAWAQNVSLEGHQTRGRGTDGTLKCSGLNLTAGGTIVGAADSGAGFWLKGPNGRVIRNLNAGNSKGTVLSAGNWYAYPYLPENKDDAAVVILIKPLGGASVPPSPGSGSRCLDTGCGSFNQPVPANHQHTHRCLDTGCGSFNTYVPISHQHSHKCLDTDCGAFNTYVSINHQHRYIGNAAASTPLTVTLDPPVLSGPTGLKVSLVAKPSGGVPPYTYEWYENGKREEEFTASAIQWNLGKPREFTESVIVRDSSDTAAQANTRVIVTSPQTAASSPLSVSITASATTASVGEETSFTAIVQGGTPPFQYDWYKDGKKWDKLCASSSKSTDLVYVTHRQVGSRTYAVRVTDSEGNIKEGSTTVSVKGTQDDSPTAGTSSTEPPGKKVELFNNYHSFSPRVIRDESGKWVLSGPSRPTSPTTFVIQTPHKITKIVTYHSFSSNQPITPGTIGLQYEDGTMYGPWQAKSISSDNTWWEVCPNITLKPGRYKVIDSNPARWLNDPATDSRGFAKVEGIKQ
ncbi:MAG: hypothetical protein RDV48_01390 [Candidatus Eremiobacteraeota bacterium]|nr:hypothetical protein [Candidatus Eremiobacteraeota bacterium]